MSDEAVTAPPKKRRRRKSNSRSARWAGAVSDAKNALAEMLSHCEKLESAVETINEIRSEYEEWKDNLPENLLNSPLGEKLEAVCMLDLESLAHNVRAACDEAEGTLDEAEALDLPRGFGRD